MNAVARPAIAQAALLTSVEMPDIIAEPLWAVFEEVEQLYNLEEERAQFDRYMLASRLPVGFDLPENEFFDLTDRDLQAIKALERGGYSDTIDQAELTKLVRKRLGLRSDHQLVVVSDCEITPPPNWSYILWDETPSGWSVSIPPMDQEYWGIRDPDRLVLLKQRARAACMAVVGIIVGFERCDNEQCFLYSKIDSVTRLDLMVSLGPEHEMVRREHALGYTREVEDPTTVQSIATPDELDLGGWAPV